MNGHAVIMGLGTFGGGIAASRHLAHQGHDLLVTDTRTPEQLSTALEHLQPLIDSGQVTLRLGEHNVSDFTTAELVVVNPGVPRPWDNRFVRAAQAAGARLTTEIALALDALPASTRLIGITGSAGKSTTASMIHAGLNAAGLDAALGGNIGGSMLKQTINTPWAVVELSSAMPWWLDQPDALERDQWLDVAVVTNLTPNHLDWHGDIDHYANSKRVIIDRLGPGGAAILGPNVANWQPPDHAEVAAIPNDQALPLSLACPGPHNRLNARLALAACAAAGADPDAAAPGIAGFKGLPHRLELIRTHRGVRWINDSKATTPAATHTALEAVTDGPVHLIVGGSDKGTDLTPLAELKDRVASLRCVGQTGTRIAELAGIAPDDTLEAAVQKISTATKPGDTVLLSPGCASFDQFTSFEHRGDRYRTLVEALT